MHDRLIANNIPWPESAEQIRNLVYQFQRLERDLRTWRKDALLVQKAYEEYKRGTITIWREERVFVEKPAEPGEHRGSYETVREKEEIPGPPGHQRVEYAIRKARREAEG